VSFEVATYYDDSGARIPNYRFNFAVLNTPRVPVSWLHERAERHSDASAPSEWTEWTSSGVISRWPLGDRIEDTSGHRRRIERAEAVVSGQFRDDMLARFEHQCVVTGIGETAVLDLAHVLARSDRPDLVGDEANVLVMNSLHHRAFDADLFTLSDSQRLVVNPEFDPGHPFLRQTILGRAGEEITLPGETSVDETYLTERNSSLAWA
jgi:hypothetical protein